MYQINKLRADHVIDFAAEELKKYLRTMMPEYGEISIAYDQAATEGFRLGLLEDFGLPNEAPDTMIDDVIHIDTTDMGGILAGSNPRSVLFAVYRFLKLNGCRFLFAGIDGEYIPHKPVTAQSYHKMADIRLRGHTTEGEPSCQNVMDYIDFHAKQELNYYSLSGIFTYHDWHYRHWQNPENRIPEPVPHEQVEQWQGMMEAELMKRGMFLGGASHNTFASAIGLDYAEQEDYLSGKKQPTEEQISYMAMLNGKRGLFGKNILATQMCMSQARFRTKYVQVLADFAEKNQHLGMIGAGLADGSRNHCECPECAKLRPSDFLVMIVNELDEELIRRNLDTKVLLSTYVDQMFPPIRERVKNPDRFYLSWAPITRSYSSSINENTVFPEIKPYVRNNWDAPTTTEECAAYFKAWQKVFPGNCRLYEYHYWRPQFMDPGLSCISRRIYEDVLALNHRVMPTRPQTVCYRLLERHAECVEYLADIMSEVCQGNYFYASERIKKFVTEFGKYDLELDRYLDFGLLVRAYIALNYKGKKNAIVVQ